VIRGRADLLVKQSRTFDAALSRATLPPPEWLALGAKLAPAGEVWVLLAQADPPALEGLRIDADLPYRWAHTAAPRRALRYVRC
jgi:16S rRNA (guanine527-N7)-methyltransferase